LEETDSTIDIFSGGVDSRTFSDLKNTSFKKSTNRKLLFGSDYPYRPFPSGPVNIQDGSNLHSSFSSAGLSLVWGATMLPFSNQELDSWPIDSIAMHREYEFLSSKIPISGRNDSLDSNYYPYISTQEMLPSNRFLQILENFNRSIPSRVNLGSARLAIQTKTNNQEGCIYCNRCLNGCPTDRIWHAPKIARSNIKYVEKIRVMEIDRRNSNFYLKGLFFDSEYEILGPYDKVYIGAGNIESFRILATSGICESSATLQDSSTFFIPFFVHYNYPTSDKSNYSLSQLFCSVNYDKELNSQIQLYDYSEDLINRAKKISRFLEFLPDRFLKIPLQRMIVGIGYLDGTLSPRISMNLKADGGVNLSVKNEDLSQSKFHVNNVVKQLALEFKELGIYPIKFLTQSAEPGEGVHSGAWLPMGIKSNELGSPSGFDDIHIIDSSVLPHIPAGPITFTVMANSARIAKESIS
jgi:ferredoxin